MRNHLVTLTVVWFALAGYAGADEPVRFQKSIRAAIERAIPRIEAGAAGSAEQRTCFTCHNQALPILALSEAKRRGFDIDEANLTRQLSHTFAHLERGKKNYLEGKGQGGKSITGGYALWALQAGGHAADETTTAVTSYLLQEQREAGRWSHPGRRPPTSGSDFTTTAVALRGIQAYATAEQQPEFDARLQTIRPWLVKTEPRDTEDQVFRLYALQSAAMDDEIVKPSVARLLNAQREDGGWAQTDDMQSDAYATGTALVALLQTNETLKDNPHWQRGLQFLLDTQCQDGSWHVATRAEGFQTYFESGFPHDEDQFISIAATSWATWALVLSLDE